MLEVSGFADSRGSINLNRQLSQRRADAVIRYLVENHSIPLCRIITLFGYGEIGIQLRRMKPVMDAHRIVALRSVPCQQGLTSPSPTMNPYFGFW